MRRYAIPIALLWATLLLASCGRAQQAAPSPSPLRNPLALPLYPDATVLSITRFHETVTVKGPNAVFASGSGTYTGQQVVAASSATFAALAAWIHGLHAHLPPGYVPAGYESARAHRQAENYGFDYETFRHGFGSGRHGVLVVVMDPQRVNQRFGTVLALVAHYRSLPPILRKPIDDRVKARIGITLSQMLQPDNPMGAALSALDQFERRNSRGIVVLDAAKR